MLKPSAKRMCLLCRVCGKELKPKQKAFCTHACQRKYFVSRCPCKRGSGKSHIRIRLPDGRREYLHRLTMELFTGEPLPDGAIVHHKDNNIHNNAIENLEILEGQAAHLHAHDYFKAERGLQEGLELEAIEINEQKFYF